MLPHEAVLELHTAALAVRLDRNALLSGIDRSFVASLKVMSTNSEQVLSDLDEMNTWGELTDGSVPLRVWLLNARMLSGGRRESRVFERYLARMAHTPQPESQSPPVPKTASPSHGDNPSSTSPPRPTTFAYDVALSFAGEDRSAAEGLAALLRSNGARVFYDKYEQASLWGKDLYQHLQSVYRDKARFCVVFLSEAYARKLWTRHELRQAQARAFSENSEYILPLRLDDTEVAGINQTTGYVDLRHTSLREVSELLMLKLGNE